MEHRTEPTLSRVSERVESLATTQASARQRVVALRASICLGLSVVVLIPFFRLPLLPLPAVVPATICPMIIANLITASLLGSQFLSVRTPSLAVLGATYLATCLLLLGYVLTFPGAFTASGLLGAGPQTAGWFWLLWHTAFPLGMLFAVLVERRADHPSLSVGQAQRQATIALCGVPIVVLLVSALLLLFPTLWPPLVASKSYTSLFASWVVLLTWGTNALVCLSVWLLTRRGTLLQVWMRVVTLVSLCDVMLTQLALGRYNLGWYLARTSDLVESIVLLGVLLVEVNHLYHLLARQHDDLLRQHYLQTHFISVVSHEFRTALTSIQGFSELLLTEEFGTHEVREFAGDMHSDATHLSHLITTLLDLDRMQAGTLHLFLEPVSMPQLVEEAMAPLRTTLTPHVLRSELDASLPLLSGDRERLVQVVSNLLKNAIKYSPNGGVIVVRGRCEGDLFHLTVHDSGMGIPPNHLEGIFERYTRMEATQSRYISGTGLGLPIARQIVQMHGGRIWAESTLGEGSTFHVTLPLTRFLATTAIGG